MTFWFQEVNALNLRNIWHREISICYLFSGMIFMEDVEVPEANMLPNVKGFKVFPHLLLWQAAAYFCRSKTLCSRWEHDLALVIFLHLHEILILIQAPQKFWWIQEIELCSKFQINFFFPFIKDFLNAREVSNPPPPSPPPRPPGRMSNSSKPKISFFYLFCGAIFCLPGSELTDLIKSGSVSKPPGSRNTGA